MKLAIDCYRFNLGLGSSEFLLLSEILIFLDFLIKFWSKPALVLRFNLNYLTELAKFLLKRSYIYLSFTFMPSSPRIWSAVSTIFT